MKRWMACVAVAAVAFGAGGCGDDDDDGGVARTNAQFCADLLAYHEAVAAAEALDPATATVDDYEAARTAVNDARADVDQSGQDLAEAQWKDLEAQIDELHDQLTEAPDDATVASILADAKQQMATVTSSAQAVNTAACPGGATTTAA
jgi:hypothetical protein